MAWEIAGTQYSFVVGTSSMTSLQFHFVKLHTDGTIIPIAAVTDIPIGILQNAPGIGGMATVMVDGISKLVGNTGMAIGAVVGTHSDGNGIVITPGSETTQFVAGQVLVANTALHGLAVVMFDCKCPRRNA